MIFGNRPSVASVLRVVLAAVAGAWLCSVPASGQSYPAPNNEAALYAAAKSEGSVVWSVGGPLEAMNACCFRFGATVEARRSMKQSHARLEEGWREPYAYLAPLPR